MMTFYIRRCPNVEKSQQPLLRESESWKRRNFLSLNLSAAYRSCKREVNDSGQ